jgi:hypothetical protein
MFVAAGCVAEHIHGSCSCTKNHSFVLWQQQHGSMCGNKAHAALRAALPIDYHLMPGFLSMPRGCLLVPHWHFDPFTVVL